MGKGQAAIDISASADAVWAVVGGRLPVFDNAIKDMADLMVGMYQSALEALKTKVEG